MLKSKQFSRQELPLHIMLIPAVVLVIIYSYIPMAGLVIAFEKYVPALGVFRSKWIGLGNFEYIIGLPNTFQVIWNTVFISLMKIVGGLLFPLILSLLLNEASKIWFKRTVQTVLYLPYFISWIILGGIFVDVLSLSGIVNNFLGILGIGPIYFLGDYKVFPFVLAATDIWKNLGFNVIVYLAAITGIDTALYEAATVDGATRLRQTWHITLPGMRPIIVLTATLSLGSVLNAGFEQVFTLYSPQVYQSGDILDTFVYRLGLLQAQFGPATAVGLFKSLVSFVLISTSYYLAYRYADYRIF